MRDHRAFCRKCCNGEPSVFWRKKSISSKLFSRILLDFFYIQRSNFRISVKTSTKVEGNENTLKNDPETESSWLACTFVHRLTMSRLRMSQWCDEDTIYCHTCCFLLSFPHCKFIWPICNFILSAKSRFSSNCRSISPSNPRLSFWCERFPVGVWRTVLWLFQDPRHSTEYIINVSKILDEINAVPSRPQGSIRPCLRKPFPCTALLDQSSSLFWLVHCVTQWLLLINWLISGVIFCNVFPKYLYAKQKWPKVAKSG